MNKLLGKSYLHLGQTASNSAPVVSLTILKPTDLTNVAVSNSTHMLAVVRSPATNYTHSNVVSVPTQRIPLSLYQEILETAVIDEQSSPENNWYMATMVSNSVENGHHPIIYAVESILSRKLGLSEALEADEFQFDASLRLVKFGKSLHYSETPDEQIHYITMLNLIVVITNGAEVIPPKTNSYSHIRWLESRKFLDMVVTKDPSVLELSLSPIEYCIHGLCIATTYDILLDELRRGEFIYNEIIRNINNTTYQGE